MDSKDGSSIIHFTLDYAMRKSSLKFENKNINGFSLL